MSYVWLLESFLHMSGWKSVLYVHYPVGENIGAVFFLLFLTLGLMLSCLFASVSCLPQASKYEGENPRMRLVLPAVHKGFYSNNVDYGRLSLFTMFSDTSSNNHRLWEAGKKALLMALTWTLRAAPKVYIVTTVDWDYLLDHVQNLWPALNHPDTKT